MSGICIIVGEIKDKPTLHNYQDARTGKLLHHVARCRVGYPQNSYISRTGLKKRKRRFNWIQVAVTNPAIVEAVFRSGICAQGTRVHIQGEPVSRAYQSKDGSWHSYFRVLVDERGRFDLIPDSSQRDVAVAESDPNEDGSDTNPEIPTMEIEEEGEEDTMVTPEKAPDMRDVDKRYEDDGKTET